MAGYFNRRIMFPSFFNTTWCLTTVPSEYKVFQNEAARVGLNSVNRFQSLPAEGPHQSFNKSCAEILRKFVTALLPVDTMLHLEDDVYFRDLKVLEQALKELPDNWDMVYLGGNLIGDDKQNWKAPERVSKHLWKIHGCWTTHAVGYHRRIVQRILDGLPGPSECMYDFYLSQKIIPTANVYMIGPMVAFQRPRRSAIWGNDVNYTEVFYKSQKLLV